MQPGTLTPVAAGLQHAFLAPSSAYRWGHCSGSAWMESQFPDLSDEQPRLQGQAAHWVLECILRQQPVAVGDFAPNKIVIDAAMMQGAEIMARDIETKIRPYYGDNWRVALRIEQRVDIPGVHAQNWGTPDVWVILPKPDPRPGENAYIVFIWDYKYGFRAVEAFENDQLVNYSEGVFTAAHRIYPAWTRDADVMLTVVQPRAYHPDGSVRSWATTAAALAGQIDRLAMAADEATGPDPTLRPRPDICQDCRARYACPALQTAVYRGMQISQQTVPRMLSEDAMGLELAMLTDAAKLMEARISGLEEMVKAKLRSGGRVPYWNFGPGRASTIWLRPDAEVIALGQMMDIDLAKPAEAITPIQAGDKGLMPAILSAYSQRIPGATKLQRVDDKAARRVFT